MSSDFRKKQNVNILVYKYISEKSGRHINDVAEYLLDKTDLHDLIADESSQGGRKSFNDLSPELKQKADDYVYLLLNLRVSSSRRYSMNISDTQNLGELFQEAFEKWCESTLPMVPGGAFNMLRKTGGLNPREMEVLFQDHNNVGVEIIYLFDKPQNRLYIYNANNKHHYKELGDLNHMTAKRMVQDLYNEMLRALEAKEGEVLEEMVVPMNPGVVTNPVILSSYLRKIASHIDNSRSIRKDRVIGTLKNLVTRLANADLAKVNNGANTIHRHLEEMKKSLAELNKLQEKYLNLKNESEKIEDPEDKSKALNELGDLADKINKYSKEVDKSTADLEDALKNGVLQPAGDILNKIAV